MLEIILLVEKGGKATSPILTSSVSHFSSTHSDLLHSNFICEQTIHI